MRISTLKFILGLLVLAGLLSTAQYSSTQPKPTKKAAAGDVHAGEEVFTKNCFQCHSVVADQVKFGPSLFGEMKGPHPKKTAAEIRVILKEGKNGKMPSFAEKLSPKEVDDVIAYLHSL